MKILRVGREMSVNITTNVRGVGFNQSTNPFPARCTKSRLDQFILVIDEIVSPDARFVTFQVDTHRLKLTTKLLRFFVISLQRSV